MLSPQKSVMIFLICDKPGRLRSESGQFLRNLAISVFLILLLGGCESDVLAPSGYIAERLRDVLGITTFLIAIIVVPVMIALVIVAWRYRSSRDDKGRDYDPTFEHSSKLELLIWSVPLLIIVCIGSITWVNTHKLDPYRPLDDQATGVTKGEKPLEVQIVSMDWKWLFIYPEYGIAVVNEFAAPVDRPITMQLTSTEVMNAFYVPALAGMIYTMPSMETRMHAVINKPGIFQGRSSNYSGAGFSGMSFKFHGMADADFNAWVNKLRASGRALDKAEYSRLVQPSEKDPVTYFASVDGQLYHDILNRCVNPGEVCIDSMGGHANSQHGAGQTPASGQSGATLNSASQSDMTTMSHDAQQSHANMGEVMPAQSGR